MDRSNVNMDSKTYRQQKFNKERLKIEKFQGWLEEVEESHSKYKCSSCKKILSCGKSDLEKHSQTRLHIQNVKAIKISKPVTNFFVKQKSLTEECQIMNFELGWACFSQSIMLPFFKSWTICFLF